MNPRTNYEMSVAKQELKIKCEACGLKGIVTVKEGDRVNCPKCGAGYVAWRPSDKLVLKCVVRPIFK